MLDQTSMNFRERFLLAITKEMIENTESYRSLVSKEIVEIKSPVMTEQNVQDQIKKIEIRELVSEKIKEETKKISEMGKRNLISEIKIMQKPTLAQRQISMRIPPIPPILRIPEQALPETVSHLRPIPTSEEIDLGKLNVMVKDPLIKIMECNGPNDNVLVMGIMGRKPTPIKLTREEIEEVIGKFSAAAKIPVNEGLFKAAFGNLVISAVISEIAGVKFVIRKISSSF